MIPNFLRRKKIPIRDGGGGRGECFLQGTAGNETFQPDQRQLHQHRNHQGHEVRQRHHADVGDEHVEAGIVDHLLLAGKVELEDQKVDEIRPVGETAQGPPERGAQKVAHQSSVPILAGEEGPGHEDAPSEALEAAVEDAGREAHELRRAVVEPPGEVVAEEEGNGEGEGEGPADGGHAPIAGDGASAGLVGRPDREKIAEDEADDEGGESCVRLVLAEEYTRREKD